MRHGRLCIQVRSILTGIGVVTRPGARICPGGPEHLPGLTRTTRTLPGLFTRTLPGPYPDLTRILGNFYLKYYISRM